MAELNYQNPPNTDAVLDSRVVGSDALGNQRRRESMDAPDVQDVLGQMLLELRAIKAVLVAMNPQLDPADYDADMYQDVFTGESVLGV